MVEMIAGGITAAKGFMATGGAAGIKKNGKDDLALIKCEKMCTAAGTFTSNRVKAAPVMWDKKIVTEKGHAQAVVINSGIANACTGEQGLASCKASAEAVSEAMGVPADAVLCASTGVIGQQLPMDKMASGIRALAPSLGDTLEDGHKAACAIMTTDRVPKEIAVSMTFSDGTTATLGGICKGSGMIHPNMCTMICILGTDAAISRDMLQKALSSVVPETFNMVSVDGDTSTNDTCVVLANGLAENAAITEEGEDYDTFREALLICCTTLAKKMAKDGEGATCLFECEVTDAASQKDAKVLARSVVSSTLTKAAIAGHDANWGRILCALGYSGVDFDPENVDLTITSSAGTVLIFTKGNATDYSEDKATEILSQDEIRCICDMHMGDASASAWGCDLTHEYVNINADYRS
ncbi:MAG: bifunctional glutamate N-acetyltransferase/amino-acid acetyltransferase ArgJ [Lachnospiraceae bacterium]|nr:bifunctional glutamate N-acetyltransferase/amino-acid acetyltransferase ArgJ [Lachnospiraceae bacterium]